MQIAPNRPTSRGEDGRGEPQSALQGRTAIMALEMKATSRWWYGRFLVNGKLRRFPLVEMRDGREQRIEVRGQRPESMKHPETGDATFLESFHLARAAHDRLAGETLAKRGAGGTQRRSVRGWHSFRVGLVTRALAAGMPEELVRRVTGHTAVDVVREHYFKPGREEFQREFEKAMPKLLMKGAKSREEQMREIIQQATPRTWEWDKARLLTLLARPQVE